MSTSHAQFHALHNPPYLRKVVEKHPSLSSLARSLGVSRETLKKALKRYEIPLPLARAYQERQETIARGRSARQAQIHYHARNAEGRHKQALIREIARGRQEGRTAAEIASVMNIPLWSCERLAATPLTRALLWAWGTVRLTEPERYALAYAMVDAGFDRKVIVRTLEIDPTAYAKKLGVEI